MEDVKKEKNANSIYNAMCEVLDECELHFDRKDETRMIAFDMEGDDLTTSYIILVDAERELVRVMALLPVTFKGDRRVDGAIAASEANYSLADGCFDFAYEDGQVVFRIGMSFADSILSKELLKYLFICAVSTVGNYATNFFLLAKGALSVEEFIEKI